MMPQVAINVSIGASIVKGKTPVVIVKIVRGKMTCSLQNLWWCQTHPTGAHHTANVSIIPNQKVSRWRSTVRNVKFIWKESGSESAVQDALQICQTLQVQRCQLVASKGWECPWKIGNGQISLAWNEPENVLLILPSFHSYRTWF